MLWSFAPAVAVARVTTTTACATISEAGVAPARRPYL